MKEGKADEVQYFEGATTFAFIDIRDIEQSKNDPKRQFLTADDCFKQFDRFCEHS